MRRFIALLLWFKKDGRVIILFSNEIMSIILREENLVTWWFLMTLFWETYKTWKFKKQSLKKEPWNGLDLQISQSGKHFKLWKPHPYCIKFDYGNLETKGELRQNVRIGNMALENIFAHIYFPIHLYSIRVSRSICTKKF